MVLYGIDYEYVSPTPSIASDGSNFQGEIKLNYVFPSEKFILGKESFLMLKVKINYNHGNPLGNFTASATDYGAYLAPNPALAFFKNVRCNVNGVTISNITDIAPVMTAFRSCFDTKAMMDTCDSSNPIVPFDALKDVRALSNITIDQNA